MNKLYGDNIIYKKLPLVVTVIFLFTIFSCKTRQKTSQPVVKEWKKPEDKSAPDLQQLIFDNAFKVTSFTAKASVNSVVGEAANDFNINLRIQTDSVIWISISPMLGIEVARIKLTNDSVMFLDRLNHRYSITDYQVLNDLFKVNVDFDIIQGVLTGNLFAYKKDKFHSVYLEERYYILSTLSKRKLKRSLEDIDINKPIVQDVWVDGTSYRIMQLSIEDRRMNKSLFTNYSDHRETGEGLFPFRSSTLIKADQQMKIDIEYSRVNINTLPDFPFKIPPGYEKMQ